MRPAALGLLIAAFSIFSGCDLSGSNRSDSPGGGYARIVTLAPSLAELVFAAGAGELLVGVSAYSDYPPQVAALPQVGDAFSIDQEQLALLKPDLLLVWQSGTPGRVADELRQAGYTVEAVRTQRLSDIGSALIRIGELTGREARANRAAREFAEGLQSFAQQFGEREDIRVFYQVSQRPLYTVSGAHYASELIELCGGSNVFADIDELAPPIDVEAVIHRNPEVMLASSDAGEHAFDDWDRWPDIAANRYGNRYFLPGDELSRPTNRLLVAAEAMCHAIETARERRAAYATAAEPAP